jgi:hypothetical protein
MKNHSAADAAFFEVPAREYWKWVWIKAGSPTGGDHILFFGLSPKNKKRKFYLCDLSDSVVK